MKNVKFEDIEPGDLLILDEIDRGGPWHMFMSLVFHIREPSSLFFKYLSCDCYCAFQQKIHCYVNKSNLMHASRLLLDIVK